MEKHSRVTLMIVTLVLSGAVLACAFASSGGSPTETANLATVTPGGHVSVSLLTPTLTLSAIDQASTPISDIATATASAATAIAQTATALAPTATVQGVFTDPAECPPSGSPQLPTQPPEFSRYPQVIVEYLSKGGAPTILEARLRAWGALPEYGGRVLTDRDFTGDGVRDILIVALNPAVEEFPFPGDMYIFGCDRGGYRLLYQLGYDSTRSFPQMYAADDVNRDFLNDIVFATQSCLEPVCMTTLHALSWSLALGNFTTILKQDYSEPAAQVSLEDPDGDGVRDIILTSGADALAAAGPMRVYSNILRWDGTQYAVDEVIPVESSYRIHVIQDADDAVLQEDYVTAMAAYQRAYEDTELLAWDYPDEDLYLRAYARFRQLLVHAAQDDLAQAQSMHDALLVEFASPNGEVTPTPTPGNSDDDATPPPWVTVVPSEQPGSEFAIMGRVFWTEFALTRSMDSGCRAVRTYIRVNPDSYGVLNSFGYGNRTYNPVDICPYPLPEPGG